MNISNRVMADTKSVQIHAGGIHHAAQTGNIVQLQKYIDDSVNVNARDADCISPMLLAVAHNQMWAVRVLLEHQADCNIGGAHMVIFSYRRAKREPGSVSTTFATWCSY